MLPPSSHTWESTIGLNLDSARLSKFEPRCEALEILILLMYRRQGNQVLYIKELEPTIKGFEMFLHIPHPKSAANRVPKLPGQIPRSNPILRPKVLSARQIWKLPLDPFYPPERNADNPHISSL